MSRMLARIDTGHRTVQVDLNAPQPISIRLRAGNQNPAAWYTDYPAMTPVSMGNFIGSVAKGGNVNTNDVTFNPHGNGTHTECIGHLTEQAHELDEYMREFHSIAQLVSLKPMAVERTSAEYRQKGDLMLFAEQFQELNMSPDTRALVIRTLPNGDEKLTRVYSNSNPPYFEPEALALLRQAGIEHLLVDLPSVDRESDGGKMLAHRAFWYTESGPRMHATITEMVYVPEVLPDGEYFLNIMVAPFGNDASPSKPVLYRLLS